MATTVLADIIKDADVFGEWVTKQTKVLSGIDQSPVVVDDPDFDSALRDKGNMFWTGPRYNSLDRTAEEKIITEADDIAFGGAALAAPLKLTTHIEQAVKYYAVNYWSASKLSKYFNLNQSDPLMAIRDDIAGYWAFRKQVRFLSSWIGVFADNDAAVGGSGGTHVVGDLTHDVSAAGVFDPGVTNFTAENFIDALGLMGDAEDDLGYIITHSTVRRTMEKADLLDVVKDSTPGQPKTYRGRPVIVNDNMTKGAGNIYHTYIFGAGSTGRGTGTPDRAFELAYFATGGGGAGQEVAISRVGGIYHPYGHKFVGTPAAAGGPTNAELQAAANWVRTTPERKQVAAVRLITTEA
jgi:hypothetical protein